MDVLIIVDRGLAQLTERERRDLLEVIEDRRGSWTIITSQLDTKLWHDHLGHTTIGDAVSDRILHNAQADRCVRLSSFVDLVDALA